MDDLYRYLDKKQIGDTVQVSVFRNGNSVNVPVKLSASSSTNVRSAPAGRRF
jgi:S1-C subfamily serine protease